ncbi:olfactomedin-like protein 2B [Schistocerca nitens]|uniref:olfactomedin-like protein 2B n=1 Tax=Schistocerca nitens TaxID=7011 RepID=UPI0021197BEF|nr:olfactomedin-like protein 2B [Schistocerca nitens]
MDDAETTDILLETRRSMSNEDNNLTEKVTEDVVRTILKNSTNGTDGIPKEFYSHLWDLSGQAAIPKKPWEYEEIMVFLRPYMLERETVSNITVDICSEDESNSEVSSPIPDIENNSDLRFNTTHGLHLNGLGKQLVTLKLMEIIKRLQHLPTTSSPQKVFPGMTNAESYSVTENAAEVPKAAILTAVSEEPVSVTAEATPPTVQPVPTAAAPSPSPTVVDPTPFPVIPETNSQPAATKSTNPPAETEPAPPPSSPGVEEKNRSVAVSKVSSLSHDEVVPNDLGKQVLIKLVDSEVIQTSNCV